MGEASHFQLERLELQHEQLDPERVELPDPLGNGIVAPDQSGGRSAVGTDMRLMPRKGLEHHRL